ncbi:MAG: LamG-like jellyroll fold domain-containing protein, partial [Flavobacteriales bacterium]
MITQTSTISHQLRAYLSVLCITLFTVLGVAQEYRSAASGNWNSLSTWQQDDGSGWIAATVIPTNASGAISIRATHTVTVTNTYSLDDVTIDAGGTLTNSTGGLQWVLSNGTFGVKIFGTLNANSGTGSFGCCASVSVESGGVIYQTAGGSFYGSNTTVQEGGTVLGNTPINLGTGTVVNHGTWTMTGGNALTLGAGGTFTNNGILTLRGGSLGGVLTNNNQLDWSAGAISGSGNIQNTNGAVFNINFNSADQLQVTFTNQVGGVVNQNGTGTFNTYYYWYSPGLGVFTNAGTINLVNGNWTFLNANSHATTSTINIAASRTLTFSTAAVIAGTVNNSGTLAGTITSFSGPTFINNGSVTLTNLPFAGTATQTLAGTGSISNLTLSNANGLTLGGSQTVTNTLTLTNGKITLGNNDLTLSNTALAGLVGGNGTNHIISNGTGAFHRQLPVGGSNYPFPIGTGASYLPVTLSNTSGPAERFGARVANDVYMEYSAPGVPDGPVVVNDQVERTWTLSEQIEGGNQATVQLQWNVGDEGLNFGRANSGLHTYNGTDWVALPMGAAAGSGPYTQSATSVSLFREFTVADGESTLPLTCPGGLIPGTACDDQDPCTANDVVNAECTCAGLFQDSDNDGTCNTEDGCPNDPLKTAPGECGCGVVDVPATYYVDADGDGYGTGAPIPGFTCNAPSGHATIGGDCDDANGAVNPGAVEICDGFDNDCDGEVDNATFSNGLVGHWLFNGDLNDHTGNANNGTGQGGAAVYTTGVAGQANGALQFGGGRYVVVPDNNSLDFGTGEFTYSVWLNWATGGSYASVIDKAPYPQPGLNAFVDYPAAGQFHGRIESGSAVSTMGASLGNSTWKHILMTRSGTLLKVYVNGVLNKTSTVAVLNISNTVNMHLGRHSGSAQQFYSGRMDNLRLYNRALVATEITDLYSAELNGNVFGGDDVTYYADTDGDGFGDPDGDTIEGNGCFVPPGYAANNTDLCPADATKQVPGGCGCGTPDVAVNYYADTDGDGFGAGAATPGFTCTVPPGLVTNNTDTCPLDPLKQAPGACGCGVAETDTDSDGTPDCIDQCPEDPTAIVQGACGCGVPEIDSDADGTPDCIDDCPTDPNKIIAGQCGCGNADTDSDGDGIADCVDDCPGVTGTIGSACDDGDANTTNDVLNGSCSCVGQLIDCLNVPGGSTLPGTACTLGGLSGIWSPTCTCELEGPDVAVLNVNAANDTIAP